MMEILGYVFIVLAILLVIFLGVMIHSGVFYPLNIRTTIPHTLPSRVAYKVYRGPYKNAGSGFEELMHHASKYKKVLWTLL